MRQINAEFGDYVKVSVFQGKNNLFHVLKLVEVSKSHSDAFFPLGEDCHPGMPYVYLPTSIISYLNVTPNESAVILNPVQPTSESRHGCPTASMIVLSRVHGSGMPTVSYESSIAAFFSVPRIVAIGELLAIPPCPPIPQKTNSGADSTARQPSLANEPVSHIQLDSWRPPISSFENSISIDNNECNNSNRSDTVNLFKILQIPSLVKFRPAAPPGTTQSIAQLIQSSLELSLSSHMKNQPKRRSATLFARRGVADFNDRLNSVINIDSASSDADHHLLTEQATHLHALLPEDIPLFKVEKLMLVKHKRTRRSSDNNQSLNSSNQHPNQNSYFNSDESQVALVDTLVTSASVRGMATAQTIPHILSHLSLSPIKNYLPHLQNMATTISSLIRAPSPSSSSTVVLLEAPRSIGTCTTLRQVADASALHYREVDADALISWPVSSPLGPLSVAIEFAARSCGGAGHLLVVRGIETLWTHGTISETERQARIVMATRAIDSAVGGTMGSILGSQDGSQSDSSFQQVIIFITEDMSSIPATVREKCNFEMQLSLKLSDDQRRELISSAVRTIEQDTFQNCVKFSLSNDPNGDMHDDKDILDELCVKLAHVSPATISLLLSRSVHATLFSTPLSPSHLSLFTPANPLPILIASAVSRAVSEHPAPPSRSGAVSTSQSTNTAAKQGVHWTSVGGLDIPKKEIQTLVELPLKNPHLFPKDRKLRAGVLLFGPPGTGKTLLAKAVAVECGCAFLSVKGPELLDPYIGESERNVREVFRKAKDMSPCVVFFDELDSLAPARGQGSDSGGVMDRVVAQLLSEIDGCGANVFLLGATNRPDLLDESLMRPGRLDKLVYVGIAEDKYPLLMAVAQKVKFSLDGFNEKIDTSQCVPPPTKASEILMRWLASRMPQQATGADCKGLIGFACQSALANASRLVSAVSLELGIKEDDLQREIKAFISVDVDDDTDMKEKNDEIEEMGERRWQLKWPVMGNHATESSLGAVQVWRHGNHEIITKLSSHSVKDIVEEGSDCFYTFENNLIQKHKYFAFHSCDDNCKYKSLFKEEWNNEVSLNAATQLRCTKELLKVEVSILHLKLALQNLRPSVTMAELQNYEALRVKFCGE